jgi:NADH pyrophosphatase NudC (nudix superfamily)
LTSEYRFCPRCAEPLAAGEFGGAPRLGCACGFVHWDNPLPVVAAIVEHDGGVILARNQAWADPKMFGLITGFLEKGESPEDAVAREVKEELSLDATSVHFVGLYPFERRNELIIAYHVPAAGEVKLNEELADYRRIAPEKLKPWDFGTGLALRDWLKGRAS